jgi:hypothetical protein
MYETINVIKDGTKRYYVQECEACNQKFTVDENTGELV